MYLREAQRQARQQSHCNLSRCTTDISMVSIGYKQLHQASLLWHSCSSQLHSHRLHPKLAQCRPAGRQTFIVHLQLLNRTVAGSPVCPKFAKCLCNFSINHQDAATAEAPLQPSLGNCTIWHVATAVHMMCYNTRRCPTCASKVGQVSLHLLDQPSRCCHC
jgi:hypothetical protein